ncbi:MAG TPA: tetratricopeptide repeat protein, partial [Cyclobacteriaceae bacterium]|nr:tetratricopeptide repeat protein [Cyclobacteriaceae bacterium]
GILLCGLFFIGPVAPDCAAQGEKKHSAAFYFRQSEVQVSKRNWDGARESLDACLREDPMYADAYYSRAMVHEHFDSLNRALTDYNIYLEFRPEHHEAIFSRAQLRMRLDQNELAKEDLLKLLYVAPGETTAVFFRQDAYTGKVDQVFTAKGADKAYLYNMLGLVTTKLGAYDEAIRYYDQALQITPGDPDIFVNRGMAKEKKLDTAQAIVDYQRALMYNSQHAVAKHNLSAISKGKVADRDPRLLDEAIEDNPNLPFAYAERAYMNFQKGNYAKALEDYNEAIKREQLPDYYLNRGLIKEKLNDPQGAYSDYTSAIKLQNDFEKAWLNRGNLLARLGKLDDAVEDYTVAIVHSPSYASAFFNRAMVLNRQKKRDLACADLQTAEKLGVKVKPAEWKSICGN